MVPTVHAYRWIDAQSYGPPRRYARTSLNGFVCIDACVHRIDAWVYRDADGELDPWFLSELLMDMGAMSVSVDDSALGTKEESPLLHEHDLTRSKVCLPPVSPGATGPTGSLRVAALMRDVQQHYHRESSRAIFEVVQQYRMASRRELYH